MPGPVPKPESQRRRSNTPRSYGAAQPTADVAASEAPALGFKAHELVESLFDSLRGSIEGKFYSPADWQRVRIELHYLNELLMSDRVPGAQAWSAVQAGLSALLVSPADKRRVGIELKRPVVDADEDAAVAKLDEYRARFGS